MQFESECKFDMDDRFSMCSQSMSCPSTATSFSLGSAAYEALNPTNELAFDIDGAFIVDQSDRSVEIFRVIRHRFREVLLLRVREMRDLHVSEPQNMSFDSVPITSMRRLDGLSDEYGLSLMGMPDPTPTGTIAPFRSFNMATISPEAAMGPQSPMMTPTRSLSCGSEVADSSSSWSIPADSPISFFQQPHGLCFDDMVAPEMERHSHSPMAHRIRCKKMLRETNEFQRSQICVSQRKRGAAAVKPETSVELVHRPMCRCEYPGCTKAFHRNEHLKRHKQSFHGEGPNRFCCEFCGKDQFNRQDNLNNHRKLHDRPNSRNRGVEYMPKAVPVIEHEERSRKKRALPKSKSAKAETDFM